MIFQSKQVFCREEGIQVARFSHALMRTQRRERGFIRLLTQGGCSSVLLFFSQHSLVYSDLGNDLFGHYAIHTSM